MSSDIAADTNSLFQCAFEYAPIGMALVTAAGEFITVNVELCRILGREHETLVGVDPAEMTHPEDFQQQAAFIRQLQAGEVQSFHMDTRYRHSDGRYVWVRLSATVVRSAECEPAFIVAQMQDIGEHRRFQAQLAHLEEHDPLTGLLNRRGFERELERHSRNTSRYGPEGGLLVLDLDGFKFLNDSLGPTAADGLLVGVARVLTKRLRGTDVLARIGGDEFAVLLPRVSAQETHAVGRSLVEAVREDDGLRGGRLRPLTISVGAAMFTDRGGNAEAVLVDADLAMYDAKEGGRNRLVFANALDRSDSRQRVRISWMERITDALKYDRFELHAQPLLDLRSNRVNLYELLIRMRGEDGELIPPGAFLDVAERSDLIQEIDKWVLGQAFGIARRAFAVGEHFRMSVNVSGRSISDPEFGNFIEDQLDLGGIDPGMLVFEVTETAAVADMLAAHAFSERLRNRGCAIAIDDFGAGFGSFAYLKQIPFDILKIDGQFVKGAVANREDRVLIDGVVRIARGLGKETVGEFTTDQETLDLIKRQGVDYAQGFHVGKPVPIAEALGSIASTVAVSRRSA